MCDSCESPVPCPSPLIRRLGASTWYPSSVAQTRWLRRLTRRSQPLAWQLQGIAAGSLAERFRKGCTWGLSGNFKLSFKLNLNARPSRVRVN